MRTFLKSIVYASLILIVVIGWLTTRFFDPLGIILFYAGSLITLLLIVALAAFVTLKVPDRKAREVPNIEKKGREHIRTIVWTLIFVASFLIFGFAYLTFFFD